MRPFSSILVDGPERAAARTIERAKRANGTKPRIPWAQVKKELQLD